MTKPAMMTKAFLYHEASFLNEYYTYQAFTLEVPSMCKFKD